MRKDTQGLSLIELMIALLIGTILVLGLVQVFGASRTAYQLSQGVARAQENARFAMDYLQRDIRMVGHYGCVNDQARKQNADMLVSHISAADNPLNFNVSVQGYEASGSAPGDIVSLAGPAAGWSPGLPAYITGLTPAPNAGSDIVVLRFFHSDGVPVTSIGAGELNVDVAKWKVLTQGGVANPAVFGVGDCTYADAFQASTVSPGQVNASASGGVAISLPDFEGRYTASPAGQTVLYRAEAIVYYVGTRAGAGVPSLYRARFNTVAGGAVTPVSEELVEGIQNLQLLYGQDQSNDVMNLTGNVTSYETAATLGAAVANETEWRRVGQIKVGLVAVSPEPAASAQSTVVGLSAVGVTLTPPADAYYRSTYESSIALRNRLYGN
ncbi:PilW family protein [Pseudoxanthomonas putridarboris]